MPENKTTLWDVLEEYAEVRDEYEDLLYSFEILQDEMQTAMEDIRDDLDGIQCHVQNRRDIAWTVRI